jgi:tetratricopeptide (TPR) repeat protein
MMRKKPAASFIKLNNCFVDLRFESPYYKSGIVFCSFVIKDPRGGSMRILFRGFGIPAVLSIIFIMLALPAMAQNRIIKGKVTDEKGEPIIGAMVTIQAIDSASRVYPVKTDKKGAYLYMGLPSGEYRVVVRAQGFAPKYQPSVRPSIQTESVVDFTLTPGQDYKLPFEMTAKELEQLNQEREKAEKRKQYSAEVKGFFDGGLQLASAGKYAEAIEEFKKALEKAPDEAYIMGHMADAYSKLDKNAEALEAYQKAVSIKTDDAALFANLGIILGRMGKTAESQEAFNKATALNPGASAQNYYNLGATLVNNGRTADAVEAFKKSLEADPNFAESYYQLGMSLSGSPGTIPDAIKALQKYIQIGKNKDQMDVAKQIIAALEQSLKK